MVGAESMGAFTPLRIPASETGSAPNCCHTFSWSLGPRYGQSGVAMLLLSSISVRHIFGFPKCHRGLLGGTWAPSEMLAFPLSFPLPLPFGE